MVVILAPVIPHVCKVLNDLFMIRVTLAMPPRVVDF